MPNSALPKKISFTDAHVSVLLILCAALFSASAEASPQVQQKQSSALRITDVLFEDYSGATTSHWQMKPGQDVVLSFRIEGFGRQESKSEDGLQTERVKLHYQIALKDPAGNPVVPDGNGDVDTTLGPRDEKWRPKIDWSATVPAEAVAGQYLIDIQVNDRIANRDVSKAVAFRVVGATIPAANDLQVTQLQYSNSDRGPWISERYFAPSETIWVQYKVIGYQVSPDNQVWVEQDWQVLDPDGKIIIQQPNAAVENERSFYPPRFLFTTFSLNLKNPKPGQYTLRLELRDRVTDQTASFDSTFFIRQ